jgi:hypothetical protein
MVYVEFYNNGTTCVLFTDDAGDEEVVEIAPDSDSIAFLHKVKNYLNG